MPLQNLADDWRIGSTGCYDAVSLAKLQSTLKSDFRAVADGNSDTCLNLPIAQDIRDQLTQETLRADAYALGKLMADHTQVRINKLQGSKMIQNFLSICLAENCKHFARLECQLST